MTTQEQKTILLVEDDGILAMTGERTLKRFGYAVVTANTGEKGVQIATGDQKVDLILMDIDLGKGLDGPQAAQRILEKRTIPIVFLTSHSEKEYVDRVKQITRYGYVIKNSGDFVLQSSIEMAFELFDAHQKMTESEGKYSAAFMTSPDAVNINTMEGLYVDINEGFTKLTGYTRQDVIGALSSEIKIWAIPEDRVTLIKGLREEGIVDNLESTFRCKDDSLKICLMSARVIKFNNKPHILSITRDITERKRGEEALQKSERKSRSIYENLQDVYYEAALDGTILEVSPSIEMLSKGKYRREDLIGKSMYDIYSDPEDRRALLAALRERGSVTDYEITLKNRDGSQTSCAISARIRFDSHERAETIVGSMCDITERKQREGELRNSEARFRAIFEQAAVGVAHVDMATGHFVRVNKKYCEILGYTPEELQKADFMTITHPDTLADDIARMNDLKSGKVRECSCEKKYIGKDRSVKWVNLSISALWEPGTPPDYALAIMQDNTERETVESALRQTSEKLEAILESISDAFFSLTDDLVVTYFNRAAENLLDRKASEVLGRYLFDAFPEARGSIFDQKYHQAAREKIPLVFETYFNSERFRAWYDVRVFPQAEGISVFFQVTTERKQAEAVLRQSEEQFKTLVQAMRVGVLLQGPQAEILMSNPQALELLGISEDQLLGKTSFDPDWNVIHEDGSPFPGSTHPVPRAIACRQPVQGVVMGVYRPNTGDRVWLLVDAEPQINVDGTVRHVVCTFIDITDRKRAEEKAARLAAIVESSNDIIISKTLDGIVTSWNKGAEAVYGYSESEMIDKPISLLLSHDRGDEMPKILERMKRGEHIENYETVRRRKDGRNIHVSLAISPIKDAAGKIMGASTIGRDISERKKMEEEREELLAELKKALVNIKTLSGLIPICASCKKIRDDQGYWNQLEEYLAEHSAARFSHGICPECAKKLYPAYSEKKSHP